MDLEKIEFLPDDFHDFSIEVVATSVHAWLDSLNLF